MISLKLPRFMTREITAHIKALGAEWNGVPFNKPGFAWLAPEDTAPAIQAYLDIAADRQNQKVVRSIASDMLNGVDRP
jgi:hypothetical protein